MSRDWRMESIMGRKLKLITRFTGFHCFSASKTGWMWSHKTTRRECGGQNTRNAARRSSEFHSKISQRCDRNHFSHKRTRLIVIWRVKKRRAIQVCCFVSFFWYFWRKTGSGWLARYKDKHHSPLVLAVVSRSCGNSLRLHKKISGLFPPEHKKRRCKVN